MPFSITWDEAYPAGTDASAGIDTYIQEDKTATRERLESLLGIADFSTRFPMSADALKMDGAANTYIKGGTATWSLRETTGVTSFISVDTVTGVVTFSAIPVFSLGLSNLVTGTINSQTISATANFTGTLNVVDDFSVATNKFSVDGPTGNTIVAGTLGVTSDLAVNTNKFTVAAASGNTLVAGTLNITSDLAVNTNKFTVAATTGDTVIAGTALVSGVATFTLPFLITDANVAGARSIIFKNTNAGATGYVGITLGNSTTTLALNYFGTAFTTSGTNTQAGGALISYGAGGISVGAAHASGTLRLWSNNVEGATFSATGVNFAGTVASSGTFTLGNTSLQLIETSSVSRSASLSIDNNNVGATTLFDIKMDGTAVLSFATGGPATFASNVAIPTYIEGTEMAAPAAPAANKGRLFFQDNGAGKTQLMVIFATGAAQQVAIEP